MTLKLNGAELPKSLKNKLVTAKVLFVFAVLIALFLLTQQAWTFVVWCLLSIAILGYYLRQGFMKSLPEKYNLQGSFGSEAI
jgi:uncharacterized membrane protein